MDFFNGFFFHKKSINSGQNNPDFFYVVKIEKKIQNKIQIFFYFLDGRSSWLWQFTVLFWVNKRQESSGLANVWKNNLLPKYTLTGKIQTSFVNASLKLSWVLPELLSSKNQTTFDLVPYQSSLTTPDFIGFLCMLLTKKIRGENL